jgi:hypothetical protein
MRWGLALVVLVGVWAGCDRKDGRSSGGEELVLPELGHRGRDALLRQVRDFRSVVVARQDDALPGVGGGEFVVPPREAELEWLGDRSIPLQERLEVGMQLFDDSKLIGMRYAGFDLTDGSMNLTAGDSAEAVLWIESAIRQFAHLTAALLDEFVPTLSPDDPKYAVRMEGLDKVQVGAFGMVRGSLITLGARRTPLVARRRLAEAWSAHAATYVRLWNPEQCKQLGAWTAEVAEGEADAAIEGDLAALAGQLEGCGGAAVK